MRVGRFIMFLLVSIKPLQLCLLSIIKPSNIHTTPHHLYDPNTSHRRSISLAPFSLTSPPDLPYPLLLVFHPYPSSPNG